MKKQIFLVAAMALTIFSACKDDDKKEVIEAPVSKTTKEVITAEVWNLNKTESKTYLNDSLVYEETEVVNGTAHFLEDNTVISYLEGEPEDTSAWHLDGNTLTIDSMAMEILEIEDEKLTLEFMEEETVPNFGTMRYTSTTYLTR